MCDNLRSFTITLLPENSEKIEGLDETKEDEEDDPDALPPFLEDREHLPYEGLQKKLDESGEQFYRVMNDRRSIRKFDPDRSVDMKVIEKCILTAGKVSIRIITHAIIGAAHHSSFQRHIS